MHSELYSKGHEGVPGVVGNSAKLIAELYKHGHGVQRK